MSEVIRVYNPNLQQDYELYDFQSRVRVSSIKHHLFVIECLDSIDWPSHSAALLDCIEQTSSLCFVTLDPWLGDAPLVGEIESECTDITYAGASLCAYPRAGARAIQYLLEETYRADPHGWGELCLGGATCKFDSPPKKWLRGVKWTLGYLLTQVEKIGCVLQLGEMKSSLFVARLVSDTVEETCQRLANKLLLVRD